MLSRGRDEVGHFEQVDLLVTRLQPRTVERERRSIAALLHTEHLDVEPDRSRCVDDVQRDVVDTDVEHVPTLRRPDQAGFIAAIEYIIGTMSI